MDNKDGADFGGESDMPRLRPTVIQPSRSGQAADRDPVRPGGTAKRSVPPGKPVPTAVPGVQRKRLEVTAADLTRISPLAGKDMVRRSIRILQTFVPEGATERSAILWGHRLQEDYGRLVSRMLELSGDVALVKASGYINRMSSILASIDLEAVVDATPGVGQYLKRLNQRIDTPWELENARIELDQLVKLMAATMDPLLSLKEELERQAAGIEDVATEIEAMALVAEYLAAQFLSKRPELARLFKDRAISLTQTTAQIRGSSSLRASQAGQPLALIAAVQNIALVTVPGWLSSLAALTTMLQGQRRPTPTEAGELDYQLRHILQQLKA